MANIFATDHTCHDPLNRPKLHLLILWWGNTKILAMTTWVKRGRFRGFLFPRWLMIYLFIHERLSWLNQMAHMDLVTSVVRNRDLIYLRYLAESGFERVTRRCAWPPGHSAIFFIKIGNQVFIYRTVGSELFSSRSFVCFGLCHYFLMYWHLSKNWMTFYSRNLKFWGFFRSEVTQELSFS